MKLLFIHDRHFDKIYKTISEAIVEFGPSIFEFKFLEFEDDKKLIDKFDPELIFYLHSIKADIHRQQTFAIHKLKYRFGCWILEDKLIETVDVGHFYDFVFTVSKENLQERRIKYRYNNIYYLSADDVYNRLKRIKFIYENIKKDRRFNDDVRFYNDNLYI